MNSVSMREFLLQHCRLSPPPLVPELDLYLGGPLLELWWSLEETMKAGQEPPYWAYAWAGGQALARYLLDHPAEVKGRVVLDFASGGGIASLAAARSGASRVIAADLCPLAAEAARANAEHNQLTIETSVGDALLKDWPEVETVLAGDVFYEQPMAGFAEVWMRRFARRGVGVLFGDPGRSYLPSAGTLSLAEYSVPVTEDLESCSQRITRVYRMLAE